MTNPKATRKPVDPQIYALADKYARDPEAILEILNNIQEQQGHLTPGAISDVSQALNLPAASAFGVASFYSMLSLSPRKSNILRVCDGPVCWLHGGEQVRKAANTLVGENPDWTVERSSCLGLCDRAPAALVNEQQAGPVLLDKVAGLAENWSGQAADYTVPLPSEKRVMLAKVGVIDPDSLESALEHGVYQALRKALTQSPDTWLDEFEKSGLTGRGGAGFPTGRKMRFVAQAEQTPKYVICNADESEPLIFKDRVLIDSNPHQLLEGMGLAAYLTGAEQGFIYIRGEYASQAARLERAIQQAHEGGFLGENILNSEFSLHLHIHRGAGAYICGEETALIESLEGKRGEPRLRPPYPPSFGYHGLPTLVNNVETYSAMPAIVSNGAEWYRSLSDGNASGTKLYIVLGHINRPTLFEAPFGITLRQAIEDFGGGMRPGSEFQFALTGGAAGTIVPPNLLDIPVDYESAKQGISLGAGAFLVCDQSVSPLEFLRELLYFFKVESCGKCTPCRVGTHQAHAILTRMAGGKGQPGDVAELQSLAENLLQASFCGLGQSVAIPMQSALSHFAADFEAAEAQN